MQHSWERSHLKLSADTFGEISQQPTERKKEQGVGIVPEGEGKAGVKGGESVLDNQTPTQESSGTVQTPHRVVLDFD